MIRITTKTYDASVETDRAAVRFGDILSVSADIFNIDATIKVRGSGNMKIIDDGNVLDYSLSDSSINISATSAARLIFHGADVVFDICPTNVRFNNVWNSKLKYSDNIISCRWTKYSGARF